MSTDGPPPDSAQRPLRSKSDTPPRTGLWRAISVVLVGAILVATLSPTTPSSERWLHACLVCGIEGWADAIRNVILFAAPAFTLRRAGVRGVTVVLGLALLTVAVETSQLFITGRDASYGDAVFNTSGAVLGLVVSWFVDRSSAVGLVTAWAGLLVVVVAVGSWASQLSSPEEGLIGQWTPDRAGYARFQGLLRRAGVSGEVITPTRLVRSEEVRSAVLAGEPVRLDIIHPGVRPERTPLLRMVFESEQEFWMAGVRGRDVWVRQRTHWADLRLVEPMTHIADAWPNVAPGDAVVLWIERQDDEVCVRTEAAEAAELVRCSPTMTLGGLWRPLAYPGRWSVAMVAGLGFLGLFLWAFPLGVMSHTRGGRWVVGLSGAAIALFLAVGPIALPATELAALSLGFGLGLAWTWRRQGFP